MVAHQRFQQFVLLVIIANTLAVGLHTLPAVAASTGTLLDVAFQIMLAIFVMELLLRLYSYGWVFFRDGWNVFDLIVIGLALIPALGALSVLRALRLLRVLRLVSAFPAARRVSAGLLTALPHLLPVVLVSALVYSLMTVIAVALFGMSRPTEFGSFGAAVSTLIGLLGGDSWPVVTDLMASSPAAWVFFLGALPVAGLTMVGLFVAVIVGAVQEIDDARDEQFEDAARAEQEAANQMILAELRTLRLEVAELRAERSRAADHEGR